MSAPAEKKAPLCSFLAKVFCYNLFIGAICNDIGKACIELIQEILLIFRKYDETVE